MSTFANCKNRYCPARQWCFRFKDKPEPGSLECYTPFDWRSGGNRTLIPPHKPRDQQSSAQCCKYFWPIDPVTEKLM